MPIVVPSPDGDQTEVSTNDGINRMLTETFIADNPIDILLQRTSLTADGSGGFHQTKSPLASPQTFRKVTQATSTGVQRQTLDGTLVAPDYVLIGSYDADIQRGDQFYIEDQQYLVVFVRDDHRYETWAEVAYRG